MYLLHCQFYYNFTEYIRAVFTEICTCTHLVRNKCACQIPQRKFQQSSRKPFLKRSCNLFYESVILQQSSLYLHTRHTWVPTTNRSWPSWRNYVLFLKLYKAGFVDIFIIYIRFTIKVSITSQQTRNSH